MNEARKQRLADLLDFQLFESRSAHDLLTELVEDMKNWQDITPEEEDWLMTNYAIFVRSVADEAPQPNYMEND